MTIEYKDSKRIVNLSTDVVNTPDINETFETDTKTAQNGTLVAWDSTDKRIEGTMSRINTNTNWIYDLGSDLSTCLLYTSPSPRDGLLSRMPSSA